MKKFSHIFIIYLLASTTIPCYLYSDCCEETLTGFNITYEIPHQDDECGNCSPMFQCNDCITSFITSSTNTLIYFEQTHSITVQKISQRFNAELNSVWQPPKA